MFQLNSYLQTLDIFVRMICIVERLALLIKVVCSGILMQYGVKKPSTLAVYGIVKKQPFYEDLKRNSTVVYCTKNEMHHSY